MPPGFYIQPSKPKWKGNVAGSSFPVGGQFGRSRLKPLNRNKGGRNPYGSAAAPGSAGDPVAARAYKLAAAAEPARHVQPMGQAPTAKTPKPTVANQVRSGESDLTMGVQGDTLLNPHAATQGRTGAVAPKPAVSAGHAYTGSAPAPATAGFFLEPNTGIWRYMNPQGHVSGRLGTKQPKGVNWGVNTIDTPKGWMEPQRTLPEMRGNNPAGGNNAIGNASRTAPAAAPPPPSPAAPPPAVAPPALPTEFGYLDDQYQQELRDLQRQYNEQVNPLYAEQAKLTARDQEGMTLYDRLYGDAQRDFTRQNADAFNTMAGSNTYFSGQRDQYVGDATRGFQEQAGSIYNDFGQGALDALNQQLGLASTTREAQDQAMREAAQARARAAGGDPVVGVGDPTPALPGYPGYVPPFSDPSPTAPYTGEGDVRLAEQRARDKALQAQMDRRNRGNAKPAAPKKNPATAKPKKKNAGKGAR